MDSKQLLLEALRLPQEERAALAGELIESLDSEVERPRADSPMNLMPRRRR
jgi:hypothetical protein